MAGMDDYDFILKYHEVALDRKEENKIENEYNYDLFDNYRGRRSTAKKVTFVHEQLEKTFQERNPQLYDEMFPEKRRSRYTFISDSQA